MKRRIALTLTFTLAALAVPVTVPMAVAGPGDRSPAVAVQMWRAAPTEPAAETEPPAVDEHPEFRATATAPKASNEMAVINVSGVNPGDRVEGRAEPVTGGYSSPRDYATGGPNETTVLTLKPPTGGWLPETQYAWVAIDTDHGLSVQGHFVTPKWDRNENPPIAGQLETVVRTPKTARDQVVVTITGANPGMPVEATVTRSNGEPVGPHLYAVGTADAKGRAVLKIKAPDKGWEPATRYNWKVTSEKLTTDGSLKTPHWGRGGLPSTGV